MCLRVIWCNRTPERSIQDYPPSSFWVWRMAPSNISMITLYGLSRPMMSWFSETYVASKLHVHSRDLTTVPPRTCLMCPFRYHYQFSSLIHFKTRQEYFFYDKESYGMLKTGFGGTWFSTLLLNFSKGNGSKWGTWPTTTPLCPIIIAMIFFIKM